MKDLDNLPLGKRLREPFVSFEHGFRPIASPTPTPPPEEVAGLVERLRGLLNAGAPESDSGWFVGSYTEAGLSIITDGLRHGMFQVVAETPQATLITEAINALPTLLDAIASLSGQVAGKEEEWAIERAIGQRQIDDLSDALGRLVSEDAVYLTGAEKDDAEEAVWVKVSEIRAARLVLAGGEDGRG